MFNKSEIIDTIELIYFAPALPLAIYVTYKHGLRREAGWLTLVILSLVRIIGASTGIAAVQHPSTGLYTCTFIMSSIGSTLLVASLTGLVNRVFTGTGKNILTPKQTRLINLISLAAIILSSLGGSDIASSDPNTQNSGHTYSKVAVMLILIQYLVTMAIAGYTAMNARYINTGDRKLFFFALAAAPFVLVRIIYSICAAFDYKSSNFSLYSNTVTAIIIRACIDVAMEIMAMTFFIAGGIIAPRMQKAQPEQTDMGTLPQHPKIHQQNYPQNYQQSYQQPNYTPLAREHDSE